MNWVKRGQAPSTLTGLQSFPDGTTGPRPLCPYPEVAVWNGMAARTWHPTSRAGHHGESWIQPFKLLQHDAIGQGVALNGDVLSNFRTTDPGWSPHRAQRFD